MKELIDRNEIEQHKQELLDQRKVEQKQSEDYSYEVDGRPEICDICRSYINSHGHCPRCDY